MIFRFSEAVRRLLALFPVKAKVPRTTVRIALTVILLIVSRPVFSAADPSAALAVSIALPQSSNGERHLRGGSDYPQLHVLLTNRSSKPVKLWQEGCSEGYNNLTFEATDAASGKVYHVKRGDTFLNVNYPRWWTVPPGESMVIDVFLFSPAWRPGIVLWDGLPTVRRESRHLSLRAVYRSPASTEATHDGVWTGKVVSVPVACLLDDDE